RCARSNSVRDVSPYVHPEREQIRDRHGEPSAVCLLAKADQVEMVIVVEDGGLDPPDDEGIRITIIGQIPVEAATGLHDTGLGPDVPAPGPDKPPLPILAELVEALVTLFQMEPFSPAIARQDGILQSVPKS